MVSIVDETQNGQEGKSRVARVVHTTFMLPPHSLGAPSPVAGSWPRTCDSPDDGRVPATCCPVSRSQQSWLGGSALDA